MTILAIDTSEAYCSAALHGKDGLAISRAENLGRGHAERLMPMVEELLREASLSYEDIQKIAVVTGPGTFTGLRIGLSVARGYALSLKRPCVGLSSLMVLAAQAPVHCGPIHAVIKGRGGQVFYQAFEGRAANNLPAPISEPANLDADQAHTAIEQNAGYVLGSGVPLVMGREAEPTDAVDTRVLAACAAPLDAADFPPEPFYLRPADAVKARPVFRVQD